MRIGIIGLGSIGRRHLGNLLAMGEREIGVYDADYWQRAAVEKAAHDGVTTFHQVEKFWCSRPEVVLICTPPDDRMELIGEAFGHGSHVFAEKPLALESPAFIPVHRQVDMVACNMRHNNGPVNINRWIDAGTLGDILSARFVASYYLPNVRSDYQSCYVAKTGAVLDVGSHAVDLATWLMGPAKVRGVTVRGAASIGLPETDGQAEMLLQHESGVTSSVYVSFVQPGYHQSIVVIGTKAQATWWWDGKRCNLAIKKGLNTEALIEKSWIEDGSQMYRDELAHFLACVREGKPTGNSLEEAVKTLDLLLGVKAGWRAQSA